MFFAAMLLLIAAETPKAAPPADFLAYVEDIRERGATESASNDLTTLTMVLTDPDALSFIKDPASGDYSPRYRASGIYGHTPSAQELQNLRETYARKKAAALPILTDLADKNRSGFVSTAEARELRRTIEFGWKAAFILSSEPADLERLCKLTRSTPAEASALAVEYERIRQAFRGVALVSLPALTLPSAK